MVAWRRRKVVEEDSALGTVRRLQPLWYELADSEITKWVGLDFTTGLDNDTHFLGREDPFRQLGFLRVERAEGSPIDFRHVLWMDGFGFWLEQGNDSLLPASEAYREADLSYLPTGRLKGMTVRLNTVGRDAAEVEVLLTFADRQVLLVAAEVEIGHRTVNYVWGDESIFLFEDPHEADRVRWSNERAFVEVHVPVRPPNSSEA
jgi:hypothetical protein